MLDVSYTHAGWNKQKINLRCQTSPRRTRTELPMGSHFWFALKLEISSDPFGCTSPAFWHRRTILSIFAPWHPETSESEGLGSPISRCVIWIFCHLKWSMLLLGASRIPTNSDDTSETNKVNREREMQQRPSLPALRQLRGLNKMEQTSVSNERWGATWRNFTFLKKIRVNAGQIVYCRFTSPRFCIMESKLAVHECRIQDSSHEFEETSRWFSLYLVNIVTVCYSYIMRIHSILIHFVLVGMIWYDVWYIYT